MPKRWKEGKLIKREKISNNTNHLTIEVEESVLSEYQPGQFITLDLPIGEKRLDRWRSYSIAGIDPSSNTLDLCIVKMKDGKGSTFLSEQIDVNDTILFKGPEGQFVLPSTLDQSIIMVCTGTGIAPFRAMIRDIIQKELSPKKIHLIFGTRTKEDILYKEEFEKYSTMYDWFHYSISLSREPWQGRVGYVHDIYKEEYPNDDQNTTFLLCGWSMMVDEAKEILNNQLGYDSRKVIYELYG